MAATSPHLTGVLLISALNVCKASQTAFAITTGGAMAPPSPSPFTPNELRGEGVSWCITVMGGTSEADGSR